MVSHRCYLDVFFLATPISPSRPEAKSQTAAALAEDAMTAGSHAHTAPIRRDFFMVPLRKFLFSRLDGFSIGGRLDRPYRITGEGPLTWVKKISKATSGDGSLSASFLDGRFDVAFQAEFGLA